jgi:hypothetical protein
MKSRVEFRAWEFRAHSCHFYCTTLLSLLLNTRCIPRPKFFGSESSTTTSHVDLFWYESVTYKIKGGISGLRVSCTLMSFLQHHVIELTLKYSMHTEPEILRLGIVHDDVSCWLILISTRHLWNQGWNFGLESYVQTHVIPTAPRYRAYFKILEAYRARNSSARNRPRRRLTLTYFDINASLMKSRVEFRAWKLRAHSSHSNCTTLSSLL